MKVLVAPDKFKGSLPAAAVAEALAEGLRSVSPAIATVLLPVADGGDGTVAAALSAGYDLVTVEVAGPTGAPVVAPYAVRGTEAVVELAAACGLDLLPSGQPQPLLASTTGLGQVLASAIERGATEIVVGVGGSASTDGGAGMARALGARLLDADGAEIGPGGGALLGLERIELADLRRRTAGVRVLVASDVDNPLLGPRGAAAVFAPQKGADAGQVAVLEEGLALWADAVRAATGTDRAGAPGAGAAGGTAFALLALLQAELRPGIDLVLELVGFEHALRHADLVVTGEGSLDEQSLAGKAPVGVARAAARAGVPVVAVAGRSLLDAERLRAAGIEAAYPLSDLEPDPARSIADARRLLVETGARIARDRAPAG